MYADLGFIFMKKLPSAKLGSWSVVNLSKISGTRTKGVAKANTIIKIHHPTFEEKENGYSSISRL